MWVRATCTHFHSAYRKEGEEFEHDGPLYENIEKVKKPKPDSKQESAPEEA